MGGLTLSHAYRVMGTLWSGGAVGRPDLIPCIQGNGDTVARRGYWGDIVSSPYLSFGIEVKDKELLRTEGGEPAKVRILFS